mmetsp:Transcript_128554/g.250499  ORF Transcript_128554/g.250499 Transcript_128554/m.250499 type:complete len:137 (+) Transcript_128554:2-412(+)
MQQAQQQQQQQEHQQQQYQQQLQQHLPQQPQLDMGPYMQMHLQQWMQTQLQHQLPQLPPLPSTPSYFGHADSNQQPPPPPNGLVGNAGVAASTGVPVPISISSEMFPEMGSNKVPSMAAPPPQVSSLWKTPGSYLG